MTSPRLAAVAAFGALALGAATSRADVVWTGDFESGDLGQWEFLLNPEHITVTGDPVLEGLYAGHIQLTNDAVWPNGLKRVELHHSPAAGRTAEGATTCFAWSFFLPEALPADPAAEIGYWESDQSYQQMMAFDVAAERITFSTRQPDNVVHWDEDGRVTPDVWHRIAMCVLWSQDPGQGKVDVFYDGEQVVTRAAAKTLADGNATFTQVGLLRGAVEFDDAPVIVIDDAVEGDTMQDVRPAPPSGEGGAGGAGSGPAAASGTGGNPGDPSSAASGDGDGDGDGTGTAPSSSASGSGVSTSTSSVASGSGGEGGAGDGAGGGSDDGCGCSVVGASTGASWAAVAAGIVAALGTRRMKLSRRARRGTTHPRRRRA